MTRTTSLSRRALLSLLGVVVLLFVGGCQSKKEMDATVDAAIEAIQSGKRSRLDKLLTSSAQDDLDDDKFDALHGAFKELGRYKERTMSRIEISGGHKEAEYSIDFDKGSAHLFIETVDDRISVFTLNGSDFEDALAKAQKSSGDDDDDDDGKKSKKSEKKGKKKDKGDDDDDDDDDDDE
jgi:hypothetical protein